MHLVICRGNEQSRFAQALWEFCCGALFPGADEAINTAQVISDQQLAFLIDGEDRLSAAIPLARLFIASGSERLKDLASETLIQVTVEEHQDQVLELFDKYNLLTLPVVDESGKLTGVITADDVISVLRQK